MGSPLSISVDKLTSKSDVKDDTNVVDHIVGDWECGYIAFYIKGTVFYSLGPSEGGSKLSC